MMEATFISSEKGTRSIRNGAVTQTGLWVTIKNNNNNQPLKQFISEYHAKDLCNKIEGFKEGDLISVETRKSEAGGKTYYNWVDFIAECDDTGVGPDPDGPAAAIEKATDVKPDVIQAPAPASTMTLPVPVVMPPVAPIKDDRDVRLALLKLAVELTQSEFAAVDRFTKLLKKGITTEALTEHILTYAHAWEDYIMNGKKSEVKSDAKDIAPPVPFDTDVPPDNEGEEVPY